MYTQLRILLYAYTLLTLLLPCTLVHTQVLDPYHYTIEKYAKADSGMVVSAHPLASKVGILMLQKGGNAVDAIIATQLALAVVYPVAGNIGGGGFFIVRFANGDTKVLDYREVAPSLARKNMYLDTKGKVIKDLSVKGSLASGVPGTIAGLFASLAYAKLPFDTLIAPAILLAQNGFTLTQKEANMLNVYAKDFKKYNKDCAFLKKGNAKWKKGDTLVQSDLATTLDRIRRYGAKEFYEGETADKIVQTMKKSKGLLDKEDLKKYTVSYREPFVFRYRDSYTVITMPPPSSGGLVLNQVLKMVSYQKTPTFSFQSPDAVQLVIEAERRSFADRAKYIGDPAFTKIPLEALLDSVYLYRRIHTDYEPHKAGSSQTTKYGNPKESDQTTHLSAVDKDRNVVVVTTTLNGNYGSFVVVEGGGFLLNNEMDDFNPKMGTYNMYGAVGEEQNLIEPNKKMLSSMSPTIVLKNGKFDFSVGSPGGTRIPTSVLQTIMNLIDFKQSTLDAVNAPRFHHQWLPDVVYVEADYPKKTTKALKKMGYPIKVRPSMGKVEVIKVVENGGLEGVGDKRGDDHAEGY